MKQDYEKVSKEILMEAVWILTNFVCVSQDKCHAVVEAGGIKTFVKLIRNAEPSSELKLQCIRALGNIAADCGSCRSSCISTDVLQMIRKTLEGKEFKTLKQKEILMRCTMNMLRSSTKDIDKEITSLIMTTCYQTILKYKNNYDIVSYAICCMAYLDTTEWLPYPNTRFSENSRIVDTIIQKFLDENNENDKSCIRVIRNIADNENTVTFIISHPNIYKLIKKGLKSNYWKVREDAAWIGYHTASSEFTEKLFDDDKVYAILLYEVCRSDYNVYLKRKCVIVLSYMIFRGDSDRLSWLFARDFCNVYPHLLRVNLNEHVLVAMEHLLAILNECPQYIGLINKLKVVDKISRKVLSEEPALPGMKLQLQNMIESYLSKKKPYTFKLIPRGCQE